MALLQALNEANFNLFDDLGKQVMRSIQKLFQNNLNIRVIAIIFDRYDNPKSIKHIERQRRGNEFKPTYLFNGGHTVPNYRKFLNNSGNKAALALFLSEYMMSTAPSMLAEESQYIILAGGFRDGHVVKYISKHATLSCSHEEADTRMVLHAIHMSPSFERIILRCDDTDVLVLLLYYTSKGKITRNVYMHAGHNSKYTNRERYIPVNNILQKLGLDFCECLPAAHAITGCDTTSSFYKIGKRIVYNKLVEHVKKHPAALKTFGLGDCVEDDIASARDFLLTIYSSKQDNLDKLRYVLASTTDKPASHLPPTEDAFKQHVLRARYQTSIWCQSHLSYPVLVDPIGNGWTLTHNQTMEPTLYIREAAPVEVRDLTHLYCTDLDCNMSKKCHCVQSGLKCTEFCSCQSDCSNTCYEAGSSDESDG